MESHVSAKTKKRSYLSASRIYYRFREELRLIFEKFRPGSFAGHDEQNMVSHSV